MKNITYVLAADIQPTNHVFTGTDNDVDTEMAYIKDHGHTQNASPSGGMVKYATEYSGRTYGDNANSQIVTAGTVVDTFSEHADAEACRKAANFLHFLAGTGMTVPACRG